MKLRPYTRWLLTAMQAGATLTEEHKGLVLTWPDGEREPASRHGAESLVRHGLAEHRAGGYLLTDDGRTV